MSVERPPSAGNTDYKRWAERLNSYLVRTRSQLAYYIAGQTASEDGVLLWDADNSRLLVSSAGNWVPVVSSGGGGGTITNYLRDDADDSTNFRLTMAGLTVDTNTLYVDSTNNEVGIGTTNPSEKLEVVGNVEATEFIGDLRGAVVFKAQAGEALTKGDVVYISGISGNTTVVSKADADDAAKMPAFGLAAKDASINTNLEVYTFGTLSGLDTSSYTEGDELFVDTTAGALVSTAPTGEGSLVQKVGKVTRSHATSGSIKIMGAGRTNATPNLNDGNIFIGDSNNQAVTASLATQVSSLETSHDDVLVDGDFTGNGFMKRTGAGSYAIDSNTYLTSETSHADVLVDGDFSSEGLMKRDATSGSYSIVTDNSSNWDTAHGWGNHASAGYLTAEANDLSTTVTWADVPDANITESSVTQHQSAINLGVSITESQISDFGTYATSTDIAGKADTSGDTFTGDITIQGNSNNIIFDQNSTSAGTQQILWENKTDGTRSAFIKGSYTYETSIGRSQTRLSFGTTPTDASGDGVERLGILAGGDINFFNEAGTTVGLRWDASEQRLGLGTLTPSATLDVVGNIAVSGTVDGVDIATLNSNAIVDGDFTTAGIMTTDGSGGYSVDTNTYLTTHQDISGKANLSGATFTGNVAVGLPPSGTETLTVAGSANLYGGADLQNTNITDVDTLTAKNVDISTTGTVTTNIATGNNVDGTNTKTVNIGTGYSVGQVAPLTTVNIGSQAVNAPNTINIGSGTGGLATNTINLKGDVEIDGTLTDNNDNVYERTVRTKFQRRGYSNFIALTSLTTTSTQIGGTIRKDAGVTYAVEHTLDLNITAQFSDINSTNDGEFVVVIYAPTPSNEATINLGTVTLATLGVAKVSGDVTKHFSAYCGLSKNSDGSNAFGFNNSDGWWYNASTNETFIYFYPYQSNTPSTGDTLYLHPFDWETSGTAVNGDTYPLDAYNADGNTHQNHFIKIELGYFKTDKTIIVRCREQSTAENIGITRISGTYTQIIGA